MLEHKLKLTYYFSLLILLINLSCKGQQKNNPELSIDGKWQVKLHSRDIGTVNTILHFETPNDSTFIAWTRKGADRNILGYWKSSLARMFTKDFKNGSLIRVTDGLMNQENDTLYLAGVFRSAMGNYYFNGTIVDNKIEAVLRNSKKEERGKITGFKNDSLDYPLEDYELVVGEALEKTKDKIYNRKELQSKEWKTFERKITKKSSKFKDDLELTFGYYYLSTDLPFSHYALTKVEETSNNIEKNTSEEHLFLDDKGNDIGLLTIKSFSGNAKEVDEMFDEILDRNYKHLIVDLRGNSGGTVEAGMAFARRVVDTTLTGGYFLTQKWFNQYDNLPNKRQLSGIPVFSEANYDLIIEGIHEEVGLVLEVKPKNPIYKGDLYVVTNNKTASTCEPIVYGLKSVNRAEIIGKTTAGAMLNGERFDLNNGFSLYVPTADYYTLDGFRIDQNGVEPTIFIENENPIDYIVDKINTNN